MRSTRNKPQFIFIMSSESSFEIQSQLQLIFYACIMRRTNSTGKNCSKAQCEVNEKRRAINKHIQIPL
jgi:hypothetical protein